MTQQAQSLSPARLMGIINEMEIALRRAGPKSCGLTVTQHGWLLDKAVQTRRSLSLLPKPTEDFDTLGNAAARVVEGLSKGWQP